MTIEPILELHTSITPSQRDVRTLPSPSGGSPLLRIVQQFADVDWRDRAACKGKTELFFIEKSDPDQMEKRWEAYRICGGCPVVDECRDFAFEHHDSGIWAGMSERERRSARRTRRRAAS